MNAPTRIAEIASPTLQLIALAAIAPSQTHIQELRRGRFDKKALDELAESIRSVGILQPPVLRPLAAAGKFEIVAGERRFLAAKIAGLKEIAANVRELTDEQVLEVQLIENLQREGLHELEEAEGYEELMKLKKINADQVGDMVGKSRSYVYARTKLLALAPEARKAFYAGELDASRALLIARIGHHDTQRQALKDITKGEYANDGPMSYREAHSHILQRYMLKLSSAPFDIKDATLLPKAGDCLKCEKRTGNQADLFGDVKNADVCTDPKCFDDKRQAHFAGARKAKEAAGQKVIAGAEAKKLLPHWEHNDNGYIRGDYLRLDAREWIGGRTVEVKSVLGKDYSPTLIQHPLTGKFIEVAPKSTVSSKAAQASKKRSSGKTAPRSIGGGQAAVTKAAEPDIEELVARRVVERLLAKPIGIDRRALLFLADVESESWDMGVPDVLLKGLKLPTTGGVTKAVQRLSDKDLARYIVIGTVHNGLLDGYGASQRFTLDACKRHKIDLKKVKAEILAEQKKAKAVTGTKPVWSSPLPAATVGKAGPQFLTPMQPSDQLALITGAGALVRTEVTKKIWSYVKKHGLQDQKNKRMLNADDKLRPIFGKAQLSMFEMTKAVAKHLRAVKGKKK